MAQRTGADGRIAPRAKARGVAHIAALLAAAALAVSGCGGEDSDSETASAPQPSTTSSSKAPSQGKGQGNSPQSSSGAKQSPAGANGTQGQGAKQGRRVTLPEGEPEPGPTSAERAQATVADINLTSPALSAASILPSTYTCEGKDTWPELRWANVPPGTQELALFLMNTQPVAEELFFGWAVTNLDPTLEGIDAGELPRGAVVGTNGFGKRGYSICPPKGSAETYLFALYALPQALPARPGFDPFELRNRILGLAGNVGLLAARYGR